MREDEWLDAAGRFSAALKARIAVDRAEDRRRASELHAIEVRILRLEAELSSHAHARPRT